ncbi:DNA-binding protein [Mesorhizobium waimense]|uniref:DNA-binding protein n=1 Tax=Mesorhizobium waimense TaxID=1300307 RepID=A0A3A5JZ91_9HYPH|nr:DNA-binding protein [Mesorhizobium waimense]RJT27553.1 DNA-binding protein [Mesorhizobium waimense]
MPPARRPAHFSHPRCGGACTRHSAQVVVARCRGQVSEGTLRNWRTMRIGPSYIKIGKAVLSELDRWDKSNLVVCRPSRSLSLEECAPAF